MASDDVELLAPPRQSRLTGRICPPKKTEQCERPTWQQMTVDIATVILPMDRDTRDQFMNRVGNSYVNCLRRHGVHERAVAVNLLNMFDRVAECVALLEQHGGAIGNA